MIDQFILWLKYCQTLSPNIFCDFMLVPTRRAFSGVASSAATREHMSALRKIWQEKEEEKEQQQEEQEEQE